MTTNNNILDAIINDANDNADNATAKGAGLAALTGGGTPSKPESKSAKERKAAKARAGARRVARENLIRLKGDAEKAASLGFNLADPLYALGTEVNQWGVANARMEAQEHEAKPRLLDALDQMEAQVATEQRRSILLPAGSLEMCPETGRLHRKGKDNGWATLTKPAFGHLMQTLHVKGDSAASYLSSIPADRRAQEVNLTLQHEANKNRDLQLLFRYPEGDASNGPQIHCVATESYAPFGPVELAQTVRKLADKMPSLRDARAEVLYEGTGQTKIRTFALSDVEPERYCAGEIFKAVFEIGTSDDKSAPVWAAAQAWRNLCLNLLIIDKATQGLFSRRHVGDLDQLANDLAVAIEAGYRDKFLPFVDMWSKGREHRFNGFDEVLSALRHLTQQDAFDAAKADGKKWSPNRAVTDSPQMYIPGISASSLTEWIAEAYKQEPEASVTGLANAVSRMPHTTAESSSPQLVQTIASSTATRILEAPESFWGKAVASGRN